MEVAALHMRKSAQYKSEPIVGLQIIRSSVTDAFNNFYNMQRQITKLVLLALLASVCAEASVESNAVAPQKESLVAQESSLLPEKHQEKRYIPYSGVGVGTGSYYGSGVDNYYNPYNRPLGYDSLYSGGYNNLGYGGYGAGYNTGIGGYGAGYGTAGYGGYGAAGYGGYGAAGGYGSGYGGYNSYNRPGYGGYRSGYGYNSYPSSYYSGGYGNSIVGGTLGALGGAAGYVPQVPAAGGYNYGVGTGTIY